MVTNKSLRSYEVSIWTLQDSFITVLKPSNLECQGQITEPNMVLKDDGENKFSFKIPMYIKDNNGELTENPIWYNTINGNIIANLRKVKVIFNKKQDFEEVFEFIIIDVEELHEGNKKTCSIQCEGLAFHELGKQGYKISLNGQHDISEAQEAWLKEENPITSYPKANINYWADKIFKGTNWRYSVQMDWSASDGVSHEVYKINEIEYDSDNYENFSEDIKNEFNNLRAQKGLKRRDIIYQEEYVSSWQSSDDQTNLIPNTIQAEQEKYQLMEAKESNRYNLSQSLAELFQIFCKYKYYYDDNYHIIDREVIFYNNFLNENNGVIDFTYKYNTNNLTRKMESSDLVTKMFVPSIKDEDTETGDCSIMDTAANKSGEDYLLNFDYMYNIGTINKEQYDEIEPYQTKLHDINKNYNEIQEELNNKNNKLEQELNPKLQNAKDMCTVATERIGDANSSISKIDEISMRTSSAPAHLILKRNNELENVYYCNFNDDGIMIETLKLYNTYDGMKHTLSDEILSYNLEYDDCQNLTGVSGLIKLNNDQTSIYAVYQFKPNLYYNNIVRTYGTVLAQNTNIINTVSNEITTLKNEIENLEKQKTNLLNQKEEIISKFENLMGPALREGKWQPEDEYSGYGDLHENELYSINMNSQLNKEILTSFGWDNELFDEEQKCYYEFGAELKKYYYPCIKITPELIATVGNGTVYDFINSSSFIYNSSITGSNVHKYMTIGSKMIFCFLRKNDEEVIPVLMLIGAKEAADNEIESITNGKIGIIKFESTIIESNIYGDNDGEKIEWVISPNACQTPIDGEPEYKVVFPRFFINSTTVKSPETMISIKQENTLLEIYKDFYILKRHAKPYITIKPEVFLRNGLKDDYSYSITYTISTAALAIYLDAIKVLQENSCPKASYEINISSIDEKFTRNAYQRLGQIAHINDYEFKFENVMGYISELNLDLDKPWEDKVIIKNYKTKFEDLFSTIVAQTEEMKKNSAVLSTAITYFGTNGSGGLINELYEDLNNKVEELISPNITILLRQYSKYEPFINAKLQQVFNEASKILNASQNALEEVNNLNIENSDILNLFKYNVKESMTGTLFEDNNSTQQYRENKKLNALSLYFKKGDMWHHDGKYYVAIMSSDQVDYGNMSENQRLASLKGWNLTSDNSLAQIKGATLNIDTERGKIELLAQNIIDIKAGGSLNLAGEEVQITGNTKVNISGPELYLISNNINGNNINAGIHMQATEIKNNVETQFSTIDITSSGIIMKAEDGIKFQSGGGIEFSVSNGNNSTSVMRINSENGIYLGSDKSIKFYSGSADGTGTGNGTSVEINQNELLFGVSNGANQSAVKLTANDIIFGVGSIVNSNSVNNIGTKESGIKINRESIKMAVKEGENSASYLSISGEDIVISHTKNKSNGAFVSINQDGVFIGAGLDSEDGINSSKRENMIYDIENNSSSTTYNGACFQVYTPNFIVTNEGKLYAKNAYLAGEIRATTGNIGGWEIDGSKLTSGLVSLSSTTNGYALWAGSILPENASFSVNTNGTVFANNLIVGENLTSYRSRVSIQNGEYINESRNNQGNLVWFHCKIDEEGQFFTGNGSLGGYHFCEQTNGKHLGSIKSSSNGNDQFLGIGFYDETENSNINDIFYVGLDYTRIISKKIYFNCYAKNNYLDFSQNGIFTIKYSNEAFDKRLGLTLNHPWKDSLLNLDWDHLLALEVGINASNEIYYVYHSGMTSAIPVPQGGTGATSPQGARDSLDVPSKSGIGASGTWSINISGSSIWANQSSGENQVGVSYSGGLLYFWGNNSNGTAGIYDSNCGFVLQRNASTNQYIGYFDSLQTSGTISASNYIYSASYVQAANTMYITSGNLNMMYNNTWYPVIQNHGNGNMSFNAAGSGIYQGYSNTSHQYFYTNGEWRFYIDSVGYCYTRSYLNLGGGNENNASSPAVVWGSNGSDTFLRSYQTSSLRVSYATSAGSCDQVTFASASKVRFNGNPNSYGATLAIVVTGSDNIDRTIYFTPTEIKYVVNGTAQWSK